LHNPCMPWPARSRRAGVARIICSLARSSCSCCCACAVPAACPLSARAVHATCPLNSRASRLSIIHHACLLHRAATRASKDGHPWRPCTGHLSIIHVCHPLLHRAATRASKDGHPWHPLFPSRLTIKLCEGYFSVGTLVICSFIHPHMCAHAPSARHPSARSCTRVSKHGHPWCPPLLFPLAPPFTINCNLRAGYFSEGPLVICSFIHPHLCAHAPSACHPSARSCTRVSKDGHPWRPPLPFPLAPPFTINCKLHAGYFSEGPLVICSLARSLISESAAAYIRWRVMRSRALASTGTFHCVHPASAMSIACTPAVSV
jgi:hypothetical protein